MGDVFEVRINFKPHAGHPGRVFEAMGEYVNSLENLVYIVGKGIDPNNEISCELSSVEIGSLKSVVECFSSLGNYASTLSKIPSIIASHMVDLDEIDQEEQIDQFARSVETDIRSEADIDFPNQVNIDRLKLAKGLHQLSKASRHLLDDETVDVRKTGGDVFYINAQTRFKREPEDIFQEHSQIRRKQETLIIKRPVFVGEAMWDLKSIQRKKSFSAVIEDKEWLEKYQNREIHLEPGYAITAIVEYEEYKAKGSKSFGYRNHRVLELGRIVKHEEVQQLLDLDDSSDEE